MRIRRATLRCRSASSDSPTNYNNIIEAITAPQGMVLSRATGSGRRRPVRLLQHINEPELNIMTAEDPVEYYLEVSARRRRTRRSA